MPTESTLDDHFNEDKHKQKYIQCQEEKRKFDLENSIKKKVKHTTKTELKEVGEKISAGTNNVARNNIETVTGKAVTKMAEHTQTDTKATPLTPNKPTINTIKPIKVQKEESNDPATFAVDNNLVYDPRKPYALCIICEKRLPSSIRGMKEHIQGRDHMNKTARAAVTKPTPKKKIQKRTMEYFVHTVCTFDNTLDNDTVINDTICVPEKSCHTFTEIRSKFSDYKCQICQMNVSEDDLEEHCGTFKHEKGMRQTQVVMGLKNELIREVRQT